MELNNETGALIALILVVIGLMAISIKLYQDNQRLDSEVQGQKHLVHIYSKESQENLQKANDLRMTVDLYMRKSATLTEQLNNLTSITEAAKKPVEVKNNSGTVQAPLTTSESISVPALPKSRNKKRNK